MAQVLILENDPDIAELYRRALAEAGHRVLAVEADPLDVLSGPPREKPDIIILDERLGSESGLRAVPELRRAYPAARVLLATADREAAESADLRGADRIVIKPFTMSRLLHVVKTLAGDA